MQNVNRLAKFVKSCLLFNLPSFIQLALLTFLFLLPWQTRLIFAPAFLNNGYYEYGTKSLYATQIIFGIIVVLMVVDLFKNKNFKLAQYLKQHLSAVCFGGIFVLLLGINFFFHPFGISLQFSCWLISGFILMVLLRKYVSRFLGLLAVWLGALVQALFAIGQYIFQTVPANKWLGLAVHNPQELGTAIINVHGERILRAYGSFPWPNALGIYLTVGFLIGLILFLEYGFSLKRKIYFLVGEGLVLVGLIFSFSRAAWLSTFIGVGFIGGVIFLKQKKYIREFAVFLIVNGIVFLTMFILFRPLFLARVDTSIGIENRSLSERVSQYGVGKTIISEHWLWGVGLGNYTYELYRRNTSLPVWSYQPVHSMYALMLAEGGVLFFVFFIWVFSKMLRGMLRENVFMTGVVFALLVFGFFDHFLWTLYSGQMLWFVGWGIGQTKNRPTH